MSTDRAAVGQQGEDQAARFLNARGYAIIERNARKNWGELDIVAHAPDSTLVFVEVKSVAQSDAEDDFLPEWKMNRAKIQRVVRTAKFWMLKNNIAYDSSWQIDLITVVFSDKLPQVTHYENVVSQG